MSSLATNIFLKGYQWPFDAQRVLAHQSSLIDVLVTHETRALGRRVFMDFLRNPSACEGMKPFDLHDLAAEALTYLSRNRAFQATPIERLRHMNPAAIEIYREHDIDLTKEPLEIDVCAQHHNGGFVVDKWWQSNIPHTFVIGEMAGTHGVKRPGGAALNSGQVGGLRAAEYIASVYGNARNGRTRISRSTATPGRDPERRPQAVATGRSRPGDPGPTPGVDPGGAVGIARGLPEAGRRKPRVIHDPAPRGNDDQSRSR